MIDLQHVKNLSLQTHDISSSQTPLLLTHNLLSFQTPDTFTICYSYKRPIHPQYVIVTDAHITAVCDHYRHP